MSELGIVEGFFGPTWSHEARVSFASFLKTYGGDFYIYAPKRDANLRKAWRDVWSDTYIQELKNLRDSFQQKSLKFGVAFSPFGLGSTITPDDWSHLEKRFQILSDLNIDYLGLFFDDMPSTDKLLDVQTQVVNLALRFFPKGLIFCPSYYTYDPILDKVFGQRPAGYVEGLKDAMLEQVDICWTGPKVISEELSDEHLAEVTDLLGRKPYIWENLYANDGPRNCKFLKLRYFTGRSSKLLRSTQAVGFNLMNQPYLSQLVYLSSLWAIEKNLSPEESFKASCFELCSPKLAQFILYHRDDFFKLGLDQLTADQKHAMVTELQDDHSPIALDIKAWLKGEYLVGPECLTD